MMCHLITVMTVYWSWREWPPMLSSFFNRSRRRFFLAKSCSALSSFRLQSLYWHSMTSRSLSVLFVALVVATVSDTSSHLVPSMLSVVPVASCLFRLWSPWGHLKWILYYFCKFTPLIASRDEPKQYKLCYARLPQTMLLVMLLQQVII